MSRGNQIMLWVGVGTAVLIAILVVANLWFAPSETVEEARPLSANLPVGEQEPLQWVDDAHQPVIEVTDETFESAVLASERPVLVDFWAAWCGPCVEMAPVVEQFAEEHSREFRVAKLNVDQNPQTSRKYRVDTLPALVLFYDGEEVDRILGLTSLEALVEEVKESTATLGQDS